MKERYLVRKVGNILNEEDIQAIFDDLSAAGWKYKDAHTHYEWLDIEFAQDNYTIFVFYKTEEDD